MNVYAVYTKYSNENDVPDVRIVSQSFSLYAAFFGVFWFLYQRMWVYGFLIFCMQMFLSSFPGGIIMFLLTGLIAGDLMEITLRKRGFMLSDIISADSEGDAYEIFFYNLS